jgi:putative SOS response-associated peptidase YedK
VNNRFQTPNTDCQKPDAEAAWLDPKTNDTGALLALLKQYPADEMEFYPESRDVNSPAVDVPGNIEPIKSGG